MSDSQDSSTPLPSLSSSEDKDTTLPSWSPRQQSPYSDDTVTGPYNPNAAIEAAVAVAAAPAADQECSKAKSPKNKESSSSSEEDHEDYMCDSSITPLPTSHQIKTHHQTQLKQSSPNNNTSVEAAATPDQEKENPIDHDHIPNQETQTTQEDTKRKQQTLNQQDPKPAEQEREFKKQKTSSEATTGGQQSSKGN